MCHAYGLTEVYGVRAGSHRRVAPAMDGTPGRGTCRAQHVRAAWRPLDRYSARGVLLALPAAFR
jgi:hypothetical protein